MSCDLHTHSINSDGTDTPAQIIAAAKRLGLTVALTDHNTVLGLPSFLEEARLAGVVAVGGTELSCAYGKDEFHLVGLFIAPEYYSRVEGLVKEFHVLKEINNIEMIERLNDAGYDITYASVRRRNPNGNVNRAHVAAEMLEKGYVSSVAEAFKTVLSEEQGFYVQPARLQLTDAIRFLREIKALPVLAHPLQDISAEQLEKMLPELIEAGLVGIETMHSSYSDVQIATAKEIAKRFSLLESGGSDYHGDTKPTISLGTGEGNLNVPDSIYTTLLERHRELYGE